MRAYSGSIIACCLKVEARVKNLYLGDRGTLVYYLQLALNRAGYPLALDGIFGNGTCNALRKFLGEDRECNVDEAAWERLIPYLKGYAPGREGQRILYDFPIVSTKVPYSSLLVGYVMEGLKSRYPFIQTGTIGKSVMGKEIPYLRIGTGGTQVFYNASFHNWYNTLYNIDTLKRNIYFNIKSLFFISLISFYTNGSFVIKRL